MYPSQKGHVQIAPSGVTTKKYGCDDPKDSVCQEPGNRELKSEYTVEVKLSYSQTTSNSARPKTERDLARLQNLHFQTTILAEVKR